MSFFEKLLDPAKRDVATAGAGMLALLAGRKVIALSLFAKGLAGLEKKWRANHPEFTGGFSERWDEALKFYDETHKEPINRRLHIVGIPFIVVGAAGLILFPAYRPMWGVSAAAFVGGWVLNFIGHGMFEKNAPAFADDPLSFIAGPVWDFQQVLRGGREAADEAAAARSAPPSDWTTVPPSA